jgi:DNA topoisomerase IB
VLASIALAVSAEMAQASKAARKRVMKRAVEEVARYLGNTPTVARASYIDPRVFDRFRRWAHDPACAAGSGRGRRGLARLPEHR